MLKFVVAAGMVAITGLSSVPATHAQNYPTKPIRVFVTSTAGGPLDVFTRLITNKMEQQLKQPFVVAARAGAVLHHEWLLELLLHFVGDQTCKHVKRSAGGRRHEHTNGLRRVILGVRRGEVDQAGDHHQDRKSVV